MNNLKTLTTNDKAKQLLKIRHKRDQLRSILNDLDIQYNQLRGDLLEETERLGVLTLKTEEYTIMRKKSFYPMVLDQNKALKDLKNKNIIPVLKFDMTIMKNAFINAKKGGNPIKGIEIKESEYISIKQNKKE